MRGGNWGNPVIKWKGRTREEKEGERDVIAAGAAGRLKLIGRAGTGIDNVDVAAATDHGVVVMKLVSVVRQSRAGRCISPAISYELKLERL